MRGKYVPEKTFKSGITDNCPRFSVSKKVSIPDHTFALPRLRSMSGLGIFKQYIGGNSPNGQILEYFVRFLITNFDAEERVISQSS